MADNPLGLVPGATQQMPPNLAIPSQAPALAQPTPAPAQQMAQGLQDADTQHHSLLGKAFRSIMGSDVSYQIDPQTGKMVQQDVPQKPGQLWRGILAATILGGATAAKSKAPGFVQGAAEGGGAVIEKGEEQDQLKRQQAQQQFKDQMAARSANTEEELKRAQISLHNAQTLHENRLMQMQDYNYHKEVAATGKVQLQPFIDADPTLLKFRDIPETQMHDLIKGNPNASGLLWEPTGTRISLGSDGQPNVEATYSAVDPKGNVKVTDDQIKHWKDAKIDQIYGKATWDVLTKNKQLPAETYMALNQKSQELTNKQMIDKKAKFDEEKEQAAINLSKAQATHFRAEASKLYADENDKKAAEEAFDMMSSGKDISKLSIKGRKALVEGLNGIIKANVDELKSLPKDPATGQIADQDRAKELYGTMENYQKILNRLYGIKTPDKPAGAPGSGGGIPAINTFGQKYINEALNSFGDGNQERKGDYLWNDDRVPPDQKLAITKQTGAIMPWSAVQEFSKKVGIPPETGAAQLKQAGIKVADAPKQEEAAPTVDDGS